MDNQATAAIQQQQSGALNGGQEELSFCRVDWFQTISAKMEDILSQMSFDEGIAMPIANEENKRYEAEVS